MKVYLIRPNRGINATGEYDAESKQLTVIKGSTLCKEIKYSPTFRGAKSIEKSRSGIVADGILTENITFKSPSTAANFVTGNSTNGLVAWKDGEGHCLKELING